jgi:hypothetical protein
VIGYEPAGEAATAVVEHDAAPLTPDDANVCDNTTPLNVAVNAGFALPATFDFASAVTVNGAWVTVS